MEINKKEEDSIDREHIIYNKTVNNMLSIIIPSRNEIFLNKTVNDLLEKASGNIEIIVVLDGYWPPEEEIISDDRVIYLHLGRAGGLRNAVNSAVEIARGEYIMKCDGHCMFDKEFDVKLIRSHQDNWVQIPTRKRLDAEKWCIQDVGKPDINYLYIECPVFGEGHLGGVLWKEKNRDKKLEEKKLDEIMAFQGSCWFMKMDYFKWLEIFDEENYGTFRKEPQEIGFKVLLSGGKLIRNKTTWYAHLHKGKKFGRGYPASKSDHKKGDEYNKNWINKKMWDKQIYDFKWLVDKFNPPGWENFKWEKYTKT